MKFQKVNPNMSKGLKDLKTKDLLLAIVAPILVCLLIIIFPLSETFLGNPHLLGGALLGILVFGVQEVIMIVAAPMLIGLMYNKWAGGASGFVLGSIFALWYAMYGSAQRGWINNLSLLGYLLSAMLIGYMSGALNQKSPKLPRLIFSGFTAALAGGLFLFLTSQLSKFNFLSGAMGIFVTMTPRLIFGILTPTIAWYILRHVEKQKAKTQIATQPHL
jgi:hypothetical protein